jgi:hypothetical protein
MTRATVWVWGRFPSAAVNNPLDRSAVNDETSRSLLGIITNVTSDEPRAFLVGRQLTIGDVLGECTDPF